MTKKGKTMSWMPWENMHRNMQVYTTLNTNDANKIILLQWKIRKFILHCDGDDGGVGAEIKRGFTKEIFFVLCSIGYER